jgi:hypothetical protein
MITSIRRVSSVLFIVGILLFGAGIVGVSMAPGCGDASCAAAVFDFNSPFSQSTPSVTYAVATELTGIGLFLAGAIALGLIEVTMPQARKKRK